ncbi:hypothetical protein L3Q82_006506 [Scortum barcoo]|uniref:Uncharacterized protein n=1 Tax=Scortum barcoo TaxID=214431 RepID=A0ACB8WZL5_9TELE|nr:hypothetical protein L3Q82_006506 [Scortum barcoo]
MDPEKVNAATNWPPLTSCKKWSPKAEKAFQRLKKLFTTASILTVLDPTLQFVVEVDASNKGIGAVLSQRSAVDNRIHPYAFLSCKLSSAERNFDVGNRELLAIKVALEEWRHWWALFFGRFQFTLSYRPVSQKTKSGALSHLYELEPSAKEPETILPPDRVVGSLDGPKHLEPSMKRPGLQTQYQRV